MPGKRTDPHKIVALIHLHRLGKSDREIARRLRMGRDTVRAHRSWLAEAGVLDGSLDELPSPATVQQIIDHVRPRPPAPRSSLEPWRIKILDLLARNYGPAAIHRHLQLHHPDYRGSLSAVKRLCLHFRKRRTEAPPPAGSS